MSGADTVHDLQNGCLHPIKTGASGRCWRPAEIDRLNRSFGLQADPTLARALGRTVVAMRLKAKRLGIRKRDSFLTARDVKRITGTSDSKDVAKWIAAGLLDGRRAIYWQGSHRPWMILEADLMAFLREHPQYVDHDRMPYSMFKDVHEEWISLPEQHRRGGVCTTTASRLAREGAIEARKRFTIWYVPIRILPDLRARSRWDPMAVSHREARLARRRNVRKGIEQPIASLRGPGRYWPRKALAEHQKAG